MERNRVKERVGGVSGSWERRGEEIERKREGGRERERGGEREREREGGREGERDPPSRDEMITPICF